MIPAANYEQALAMVKAAIARIKSGMERFREAEANSYASSETRAQARISASAAIQEFAYQWPNVDLIIREKQL